MGFAMAMQSLPSEVKNMVLNMLDGIALGIPSSVLVPEVQRKYDVEMQALNQLYSQLSKEFNDLSLKLSNNAEIKSQIINDMQSMSPLGNWYQTFKTRLTDISAQDADDQARLKTVNDVMNRTSKRIAELDTTIKDSNDLSGAIRHGTNQLTGDE